MKTRTIVISRPCELDPDLFHTPNGERIDSYEYAVRIATAREYCVECPIMLACRDKGRELHERGIWGGETDAERTAAGYPPGKPDCRPPCGTDAGARWHRRRENAPPCPSCRTAERQARIARAATPKNIHLAA
jgi:hypothetical protein